uniref:Ig-like domain-containing protein n=1 Tax=Pygocentrus nattereri TaxID=42514 RepID=A0A3B4ENM3_PYGNA
QVHPARIGNMFHVPKLTATQSVSPDAPRHTTVQVSPRGAIAEGDSAILTCSSEGAPAVESFAWFKEGESGSVPDSFKPELRLWSLDYRDYGEYFCVARNSLGTDRSRPVLVNVTCKGISAALVTQSFIKLQPSSPKHDMCWFRW